MLRIIGVRGYRNLAAPCGEGDRYFVARELGIGIQPHLTVLPYRTPDDYVAVMKLATLQVVLFVRTDAPWKNARALLEHARANPGKVKVGVRSAGLTEIVVGVLPGEVVVTTGSHVLKSEILKSRLGAGCADE